MPTNDKNSTAFLINNMDSNSTAARDDQQQKESEQIQNSATEKVNQQQSYFSQFVSRAKDYVRWAYMESPINFSNVTGYRYPHVPRKTGNPILGRIEGRSDGLKDEVFKNIGELALAEPDLGLCYSWMGTKCSMLMIHPRYINQAFVRNADKISRAAAVENNFSLGFGSHTIFTLPSDQEWEDKRNTMKDAIFKDSQLEKLAKPMEEIIEEAIKKMTATKGPIDLDHFFCDITMDVMARTQMLADDRLADHIDDFTHAFENLLGYIFEFKEILQERWMTAVRKHFNIGNQKTQIATAKEELYDVIKKHYLDVYKDKIIVSDNLVTKMLKIDHGKELTQDEKAFSLYLKNMLGQLALIFLVGHDTTARLLYFGTRLLDKHPQCMEKLRKELADYHAKYGNKEWTRADLMKLPYLQMVLRESLRLYPSAPLMGYMVTEKLTLGDIPLTKNASDYQEAMEKRDKTHDVTLHPGDIVLLAAPLTHSLEKFYPNAQKFDPERWSFLKNPHDPEDARAIMRYDNNDSTLISFGVGKRACVGKNFAIQEASLAMIHLAENYDIKINNNEQYPFPYDVVGTIRPAKVTEPGKNVSAFFTPRKNVEASAANDAPSRNIEEVKDGENKQVENESNALSARP